MRDIKFRAWDTVRGKMFPVFAVSPVVISVIAPDDVEPRIYRKDAVRNMDVLVLMQYAGLKDKRGVDFYEGDLFRTHIGGIWKIVWGLSGFIAVPVKAVNKWGGKPQNTPLDRMGSLNEVIGNIYENPELLV